MHMESWCGSFDTPQSVLFVWSLFLRTRMATAFSDNTLGLLSNTIESSVSARLVRKDDLETVQWSASCTHTNGL